MSSPAWNAGLCGCLEDIPLCLCGTFCTPCLYCSNLDKIRGGDWFCPCLLYVLCGYCRPCLAACTRESLRSKYDLPTAEFTCEDCCLHLWCHCCAVIQEAREIKYQERVEATNTGIPMATGPGSYAPTGPQTYMPPHSTVMNQTPAVFSNAPPPPIAMV